MTDGKTVKKSDLTQNIKGVVYSEEESKEILKSLGRSEPMEYIIDGKKKIV